MIEVAIPTLHALQVQNKVWTQHNFPGQTSGQMLEGIFEECGELAEAGTVEQVLDAAADVMIYMASFCNHMGWDFQELWDKRFAERLPGKDNMQSSQRMLIVLGKLAHHHLKAAQGIRGKSEAHNQRGALKASQLMGVMQTMAYLQLIELGEPNLPDLVQNAFKVWKEEVQPRDWASQKAKSSVDAG